MSGEGNKEPELEADDDVAEDTEATVVMSDDEDSDESDSSSEINVDKLVADIERLKADAVMKKRLDARKRIDAMKDDLYEDDVFASTYNFDLDDDLPT
ncbi:MAG: hypothetical protein O2907_02620 [Proteobacteria bacterium]|nr:hypothetical protein [Pseudomonadota bacterium]MDA1063226.1 hypothetical protein [Pseudomonadota bacterium]